MNNLLNFHSPVFGFQEGGEVPDDPYGELISGVSQGPPELEDVLGEFDFYVPPQYMEYLYEYDKPQEVGVRAGTKSSIEGMYGKGAATLAKARRAAGGGGFAGYGGLLDMTVKDIYTGVGGQAESSLIDSLRDITGMRTTYGEDISSRLMDIERLRGEEFAESEEHEIARGGGTSEQQEDYEQKKQLFKWSLASIPSDISHDLRQWMVEGLYEDYAMYDFSPLNEWYED